MKVITRNNLKKIFKKLGVKEGDDIFLHTSMKNFGYFVNGPYDILNSIYDIINLKKGTLLIPTHTGQMTNPRFWKNKVNYKLIKNNINEYDPNLTLPRNRGLISLLPLIDKRFKRSSHPLNSISAILLELKVLVVTKISKSNISEFNFRIIGSILLSSPILAA